MSPCAPLNVSMPDTSPNPIPGFGMPSSLKTPKLAELPEDFPEDLIELFQKLKLLIPPGALKPQLSLNFAKDLFDGIGSFFIQLNNQGILNDIAKVVMSFQLRGRGNSHQVTKKSGIQKIQFWRFNQSFTVIFKIG